MGSETTATSKAGSRPLYWPGLSRLGIRLQAEPLPLACLSSPSSSQGKAGAMVCSLWPLLLSPFIPLCVSHTLILSGTLLVRGPELTWHGPMMETREHRENTVSVPWVCSDCADRVLRPN